MEAEKRGDILEKNAFGGLYHLEATSTQSEKEPILYFRAFIEYYNYQLCSERLGNVTPYNVYTGRNLEIIQRRKEVKSKTLEARGDYNVTAREQGRGL